MKKIITLFIALLTAITISAAGNTSAQAKKILDKAAAKVNLKSGASANFTISGGKLGGHSGSIAIKGNKFNARTDKAIIWYDGKTQWLLNTKSDEVNVSNPSPAVQQSMNPYTFLNLYKQGYTLSYTNAASGYQVHLVGKGKSISELYILINKSYTIKQVKMQQKGQWITINISNFKAAKLSDATFTFNRKDYPKAEVIDLR